jgi:hypothetical protein
LKSIQKRKQIATIAIDAWKNLAFSNGDIIVICANNHFAVSISKKHLMIAMSVLLVNKENCKKLQRRKYKVKI